MHTTVKCMCKKKQRKITCTRPTQYSYIHSSYNEIYNTFLKNHLSIRSKSQKNGEKITIKRTTDEFAFNALALL